jgi:hypothetical protein
MSEQSQRLLDVACAVERLEAERNELAIQLDALNRKMTEIVRAAYRRGYRAGWTTGRSGQPAVTNAEVRARGWMREACR